MAKNKKNSVDNTYLQKLNKEQEEKKAKEKNFVNPARKLWGKIIIVTLAAAMCLGSFASLIYFIVQSIRR